MQSLHRHKSARWNDREVMRLCDAITRGEWVQVGLHREVVDGQLAGWWKVMKCGCVFVVQVADFETWFGGEQ